MDLDLHLLTHILSSFCRWVIVVLSKARLCALPFARRSDVVWEESLLRTYTSVLRYGVSIPGGKALGICQLRLIRALFFVFFPSLFLFYNLVP